MITNAQLPDTHLKAFYYIAISYLIDQYSKTIKHKKQQIFLKTIALKA
jgi:hypothetical protein